MANTFCANQGSSGAREHSERLPHISSPRCGAGYETHWWELIADASGTLVRQGVLTGLSQF